MIFSRISLRGPAGLSRGWQLLVHDAGYLLLSPAKAFDGDDGGRAGLEKSCGAAGAYASATTAQGQLLLMMLVGLCSHNLCRSKGIRC